MQLGYCYGLKHQAVIDICIVSSAYLIRAIAGGAAADIPLSQWFLLTAAFGSLFMVAGKRYAELQLAERTGAAIRKSLKAIPAPIFDSSGRSRPPPWWCPTGCGVRTRPFLGSWYAVSMVRSPSRSCATPWTSTGGWRGARRHRTARPGIAVAGAGVDRTVGAAVAFRLVRDSRPCGQRAGPQARSPAARWAGFSL
ncbi:decaprenylphosphoryl-5-phosphoribose synthase domain protein [Mycobacterium kansasii]|uniref:Decaprenylphosphoryl-5-phosphoribose synthase domain protein n=1 Tax=Mycobacterium kansasii TaxID=1768 RepID=A0A1V3X1N9_MYCKA|nr:decaprenylphosphoryl-5-phosphoribose synthase domain protein [Mycobacterium kansasii]